MDKAPPPGDGMTVRDVSNTAQQHRSPVPAQRGPEPGVMQAATDPDDSKPYSTLPASQNHGLRTNCRQPPLLRARPSSSELSDTPVITEVPSPSRSASFKPWAKVACGEREGNKARQKKNKHTAMEEKKKTGVAAGGLNYTYTNTAKLGETNS